MKGLWLLWMMLSGVGVGQTIELDFALVEHRVKVVLPQNYDVKRAYPAVLYYHGSGGLPSTSLIRSQLEPKDWIVVGMSYVKQDGQSFEQWLASEKVMLRSVQRYLQTKYRMDRRKCYVAGFSKGGWLVDLLLQSDNTLAGGVILGAGHRTQLKAAVKPLRGATVFVATGRLDGNYPYALRAVLFHRSRGAQTSFVSIPEIGHSFPAERLEALHQWFSLRGSWTEQAKETARRVMQTELEISTHLDDYPRWRRLRQIKNLPYSKVLGKDWVESLRQELATLEQKKSLKQEVKFLKRHQQLLGQEVKKLSVERMIKVNAGYRELISHFPDSRQLALAKHDYRRTQKLETMLLESRDEIQEPKKEVEKPAKKRRRIPRNPMVR